MQVGKKRIGALAVLIFAGGCKEAPLVESNGLTEVDANPTGVWVGDAVSTDVAAVPVFATNAVGAAVPGASITVAAEGASLDVSSPIADALGWAEVAVTLAAPGVARVQASVPGGTAEGLAYRTERAATTYEWPATALGAPPTALAAAGGGLAWADDAQVWWAPVGGVAPVRVAAFGLPVAGLVAVQGDNDGVTDLLVWTADTVVVLRGRDGGGLAFAAGWRAAEPEVVGAAVDDTDGDALADVLIARSDLSVGRVERYRGDGRWGYAPLSPSLTVDHPVVSLSAEDMDVDGAGDVTLLTDGGILRRYEAGADGWLEVNAGAEYDLALGATAHLLPSGDFNGDGIVDVIAYGPSADGSGHGAVVVTVGSRDPTKYTIFGMGIPAPADLYAVSADLDGDGLADLALSTPDALCTTAWVSDDDGEGFRVDTHAAVPFGPIAVAELDGDGTVPDLAIAGPALVAVRGTRTVDDPATVDVDEFEPWQPRTAAAATLDLDLAADPYAGDVGGDGVLDLVGLARTGAGLVVGRWAASGSGASATLTSAGSVTVSTTGAPVDVAVCDDRAWVLVGETDGTPRLHVVRAGPGAPALVASVDVGDATDVACGDFAEGDAAVVDADGLVVWIDADGSTAAGDAIGPAYDIAAVDPDGDSVDVLVGCDTAGCSVLGADLDGDGRDEQVEYDGASISVVRDGAAISAAASGVPSIGDADGDGVDDLLVAEDGAVTVIRAVSGALVPASARFVRRAVQGRASVGDLDGDGLPDVFLPEYGSEGIDGYSGRVVVARAVAGGE